MSKLFSQLRIKDITLRNRIAGVQGDAPERKRIEARGIADAQKIIAVD